MWRGFNLRWAWDVKGSMAELSPISRFPVYSVNATGEGGAFSSTRSAMDIFSGGPKNVFSDRRLVELKITSTIKGLEYILDQNFHG
jgi:hypothetical protein